MADFIENPVPERLTYTLAEAQRVTHISRSTLFALIKSGDIPVVKVGARTLIRRAALEAFLTQHETRRAVGNAD